ncbi:MAG TPA: zinc-dependent metalloprotease, partial [Gemmatimonadales bacterium]|nr:zinc-dependent metalloprotease [Gemmatimonadales bacterium]
VRWAASLTRNAQGPSTSDPRTGEIIESDIVWYHNHMRSYRNRLLIETGAANPAARSLDIPEELMGETMRKVITHEVGHALGLPHNMMASSSYPVDSLRSPSFVRRYGIAATIMDYARQNYVAQPGDGLEPVDFVRALGPFDDFVINWGYRVIPEAATPEAERPVLHRWLTEQAGPMPYRYLPQSAVGVDPRAQTEDIGDDPVRASTLAVANLRRVVPSLVAWTTAPGEDYTELDELFGETLEMWSLYMGHVVNVVGGLRIDLKTADQAGAVYGVVPKARQKAAMQFLADQAFRTPGWLLNPEILGRIGPPVGANSLSARQAGILTSLLSPGRLGRMTEAEALDPAGAYPLSEFMDDLRRALWTATPDASLRLLQRVHLERLEALIDPPQPATPATGPGSGGSRIPPLQQPPNLRRSDIAAVARNQLRLIQASARQAAGTSTGLIRAHYQDVVARIDRILEGPSGR